MQNAVDIPSFTEEAANFPFFCQSFSLIISLGSCSLIQASLIIRTTIPFSSRKYLFWCLNSHQWWCIWSRDYPIVLLFPFLSSLKRTWGVKHFAKTSGGDFWVRQMPGGQWMGCMCVCTCCGGMDIPGGTGRALSLRKERGRTPRTICQKRVEGDEQDPFVLTGITWPWQGPQFLPSSGNRMLLKAS